MPNPGIYQRGEDSRLRIIETALDVFGQHGLEGATTRQLAQSAGVNLAAIPYYFGGKEGLYRAVAEHVVATIATSQETAAEKARAALADPELKPEAALDLLLDILDSMAAMLIGAGPADRWARFIMREQMHPTAAFDIIYDGFQSRMHGICSGLVGRTTGQGPDDPDVLITTSTIIGQILVFRAARATMQRRLGWTEFTPERIALIQKVVRRQVRAMLLTSTEPKP